MKNKAEKGIRSDRAELVGEEATLDWMILGVFSAIRAELSDDLEGKFHIDRAGNSKSKSPEKEAIWGFQK